MSLDALPPWFGDLLDHLGPTPVSLDELVTRLRAEYPDVTADDLEAELRGLPSIQEVDGGWVDLFTLADGVVLTHLLSAVERDTGVLEADPDFSLWAVLASNGLPLTWDGPAEVFAFQGEMRGPDGWLDDFAPGTLLSLRMVDSVLELSEVVGEQETDESVGELLEAMEVRATAALAAYLSGRDRDSDHLPEPGLPVLSMLAEALVARPNILRRPAPPLALLIGMSGLEHEDGLIGLAGVPWDPEEAELLNDDEIMTRVRASKYLAYVRLNPDLVADRTEQFFDDLHGPAIAVFIADRVELIPLSDEALDLMQSKAEHACEKALVASIRARSAEGAGNTHAAIRHTQEALCHDPDLKPALLDAAAYAADRGDASAVDGYLKRAGVSSDYPLRSALGAVVRLPTSTTSRNQPCPCGSGRKYKMCCLRNEVHPLRVRAPFAYARLLTWVMRAPSRRIVDGFLRLLDPESLDEGLLAFDLAIFDAGMISSYLEQRGALLREDERALVERWGPAAITPYEVTEVRPGASVTLSPLPGGEPVTLQDRALSTSVRRLDVLVARILHDGEKPCVMINPRGVPRGRRHQLLSIFESYSPFALASFFGPEPPPKLQNREGHELVFCRAEYTVPKGDAAQAWRRLSDQLIVRDRSRLDWTRSVNGEELHLGSVERKGQQWTLETNSRERFEELKKLMLDAAPSGTLVSSSATPADEAMASEDGADAPEPAVPDAEMREAIREYVRQYEQRWLDDSIPALGGRTPRQAVAQGGKALADLEALLDDFEWASAQGGDSAMSADRLRSLLGLDKGKPGR